MHQPSEQTLICGLSQGLHSKVSLEEEIHTVQIHSKSTNVSWVNKYLCPWGIYYLLFSLGLLHILSTHFDPWGEYGASELQYIDAQQMAQFLSSCVIRHGRLVMVLLLCEGNVPKLEHRRDHLQHGWGEVRQGEGRWFIAKIKCGRNKLLSLFLPSYIAAPPGWSPL